VLPRTPSGRTSHRHAGHHRAAVALLSCVAVVLAGCSSSGVDTAAPSASPSPTRELYRGGDTGVSTSPPTGTASTDTSSTTAASSPTAPVGPPPTLRVTPVRALYDTPLTTDVSGLAPGSEATLAVSTVDDDGATWRSTAVFRADAAGHLSTRQTPVSGTYAGADPMGLVETLSTTKPNQAFVEPDQWLLRVSVLVGGVPRATVPVLRLFPDQLGVTERDVSVARDGVTGELYLPTGHPAHPGPAVVVFGGSEGGLSTSDEAALFAARGFPALAVAYFDDDGVPATLTRVPLEYFDRAARLLSRQPGVDPHRVALLGSSAGGEAALAAAAAFPARIAGAIAVSSPAAVLDSQDGPGAEYTLAGHDLPTADEREFEAPSATSGNTIAVEKAGRVLLVCGEQDLLVPSCASARALQGRAARHGADDRVTVLSYDGAGHAVNTMDPYFPDTQESFRDDGETVTTGGTWQGDQAGEAAAWPKILSWLASLPAAGPHS